MKIKGKDLIRMARELPELQGVGYKNAIKTTSDAAKFLGQYAGFFFDGVIFPMRANRTYEFDPDKQIVKEIDRGKKHPFNETILRIIHQIRRENESPKDFDALYTKYQSLDLCCEILQKALDPVKKYVNELAAIRRLRAEIDENLVCKEAFDGHQMAEWEQRKEELTNAKP